MICSKCGAENPDDAYFCGTCGVNLRSNFSGAAGPSDSGSAPALHGSAESHAGIRVDAAPRATDPMPVDAGANPFDESEPTARAAYAREFGAPEQDAVLPPPPPVSVSGPPPRPDLHAAGAGLSSPPLGAAPPPVQGYGPGYAPPPVYAGPGGEAVYGPPLDGNTSGMGDGYPVPPQAKGWNFGGFVPFGLFAWMNGNTTWGIIGAIGSFVGILGLVYAIYIGASGKELAWKGKRFNSLEEYEATMRGWNIAGLILLGIGVFIGIAYFVFLMAVVGLAASGAMDPSVTAPAT
jgi:hypothetical protein